MLARYACMHRTACVAAFLWQLLRSLTAYTQTLQMPEQNNAFWSLLLQLTAPLYGHAVAHCKWSVAEQYGV